MKSEGGWSWGEKIEVTCGPRVIFNIFSFL